MYKLHFLNKKLVIFCILIFLSSIFLIFLIKILNTKKENFSSYSGNNVKGTTTSEIVKADIPIDENDEVIIDESSIGENTVVPIDKVETMTEENSKNDTDVVEKENSAPVLPAGCDCSIPCTKLSSCEDAYFQLNECKCAGRDVDGDGVPCEALCNKKESNISEEVDASTVQEEKEKSSALEAEPVSVGDTKPVSVSTAPEQNYICDCKKSCSKMISCKEAKFQLIQCGCVARDSDKDGIPCESLCK